jgi:Tfp pilus assembly protein PilV
LSKKIQSGQSLIEVLTALAVVLLVIIALIRATTTSMKGSDFAKTQSSATSYGQEAIEWIRAERDKNWDNLADGTYCLKSSPIESWPSQGDCGDEDYLEGTKFKRRATLTKEGEKVKIEVIVGWQDSSGDHQSQLSTYLTNWR